MERPWLQHHIEDFLSPCQHPIEKWRVDFYSVPMTDALTEAQEAKVAEVAAREDLVERYHAAREARARSKATFDHPLHEIQRAVIRELRPGRTWAEVGRLIGTSGSWAEALATGRSSKRRKTVHAAESTPRARTTEGHSPDTETPDQ